MEDAIRNPYLYQIDHTVEFLLTINVTICLLSWRAHQKFMYIN